MLYVDWGAANMMVGITMLLLVILPIVILGWVFTRKTNKPNE